MANEEEKTTLSTDYEDDFESLYANVFRFESNVFDLKLVFGQIDLSQPGKEIHRIHTGVTIPWTLVKIALYFLRVNLLAHEAANGTVTIPPAQLPPPPRPFAPEDDVNATKLFAAIKKAHEEFLAGNF